MFKLIIRNFPNSKGKQSSSSENNTAIFWSNKRLQQVLFVLLTITVILRIGLRSFFGSVDHATEHFKNLFLHRILNPLFVFESPPSHHEPLLPIDEIFPRHSLFESHWKEIRDEVLDMIQHHSSILIPAEKAAPKVFQNLPKYSKQLGNAKKVYWKATFLKVYDNIYKDNIVYFPKTSKLLDEFPEILVLMISVMEYGTTVPVHRGPLRSTARYHLPLVVPGYDLEGNEIPLNALYKSKSRKVNSLKLNSTVEVNKGECVIVVGEDIKQHYGRIRGNKPTTMVKASYQQTLYPTTRYYWKPGKGVLFDDTFAHSVANHHPAGSRRIVLFIDIERPGYWLNIGSTLFWLIKKSGLPAYFFLSNQKMNEKGYNIQDVRKESTNLRSP